MKKTVLLLTAILTFSAVTLYAQDAQTHFDNGEKLGLQRDFDGAIKEFTEAIRIDPKFAMAYFDRGTIYLQMKGDYDRAIADYSEAIRLDPKYEDAYYWRGTAYRVKKDYDRAIADYTEIIKLNKLKLTEYNAYYQRGNLYEEKKDYDRAIADYTESIKLHPKFADGYNKRGTVYFNKKDYNRAITDFTEAINLAPKYADAYNNRGVAYENKKDYDRAIADFEAALQINPNDSQTKNNLAATKANKAASELKTTKATDLYAAYNTNQLRADAQYKNKLVKVTGKVTKIGEDRRGGYIELDDHVQVYFKSSELSKAIALNKGQMATLIGTCNGEVVESLLVINAVFSN